MEKIGLCLATLASNLRPPGLKRIEVRAGRDLFVCVLTRKPDLEVVRFRRTESRVTRREHDAAKRQLQTLQYIFRITREFLVFVFALLGTCELYELHLLKLMLAYDPAYIATVRAGFAPEARSIGTQR